MANYRLSQEAEDDLYRIWLYGLETFGQRQADSYYDAFFDRFEAIANNPYQYPEADERPSYRKSVCGVDTIYYRIEVDTIIMIRVLGRQDIDENL